MLTSLPYDMLFVMIPYLTPHEFQQLYLTLQDEMLKQCVIQCTTVLDVLDNELVEWFQCNHIKIIVQEHIVESLASTSWFRNGKLHRDYDLPAYISTNKKVQCWYQNGKLHRINDKPASIVFYENFEYVHMKWFENGVLQHVHNDRTLNAIHFGIISTSSLP